MTDAKNETALTVRTDKAIFAIKTIRHFCSLLCSRTKIGFSKAIGEGLPKLKGGRKLTVFVETSNKGQNVGSWIVYQEVGLWIVAPFGRSTGFGKRWLAYCFALIVKEYGHRFSSSWLCLRYGKAKRMMTLPNKVWQTLIAGARSVSPVSRTAVSQVFFDNSSNSFAAIATSVSFSSCLINCPRRGHRIFGLPFENSLNIGHVASLGLNLPISGIMPVDFRHSI